MAESTLTVAIRAKDEASGIIKGLQSKFSGSFGTMTSAVSALTGAAGGLFAYLSVDQFADVGGAIADMAKRTGVAAESISALRVAAQEGGASIETVEGAIKKMQLATQEGADGTYAIAEAMRQFGITVYEDFPSMEAGEQFEFLAQKIGAIKDPATRTQAAVAAFGKSGADLIPLMEDGAFSMEEWTKKAKDLGVAFDDEAAAKADALGDAMDDMKIVMQGVQLQIASALAPVVTDLANKLTPLIGAFAKLAADNPNVVLAIGAAVAGLTLLGTVIGPIMASVTALGAAFAFLVSPIGIVVVALAALGIAIGFLIANWDMVGPKVAEVWASIVSTVTTFTGQVAETISGWAEQVVQLFSDMWEGVKDAFMTGVYFILGIVDFLSQTLIGVSLPQLVTTFLIGWNFLIDTITGLTQAMAYVILGIWDGIRIGVSLLFTGIMAIFEFFAEPITAMWSGIWNGLVDAFNAVSSAIKSPIQGLFDWLSGLFAGVQKLVGSIASAVGSLAGGAVSAGKSVSSKVSGKKALGGPVASGASYLVGENGPEIFQPYTGGTIIPNSRSGGGMGGGVNVQISVGNVSSDVDIKKLGRMVGDEIMRTLKQNQLIGA